MNRLKQPPRSSLMIAAAVVGAALFVGSPAAPAQAFFRQPGYLTGIDVSHWQGYIRWSDVAASGIRFVIAKATDGRSLADSRYARNRSRADALGLAFTAYHFARPDRTTYDAQKEADFFVATAGLAGRHMIPALDLEVTGGLGRDALKAWVRRWLARVEATLGVKPMIYSSAYFWKTYLGDTTWFADNGYHVLWIAHWDIDQPSVPAGDWSGHGWTFWQRNDCGSVPGIDGCVDIDVFEGTDLSPVLIKNNH